MVTVEAESLAVAGEILVIKAPMMQKQEQYWSCKTRRVGDTK